jgi:hypothetical protein
MAAIVEHAIGGTAYTNPRRDACDGAASDLARSDRPAANFSAAPEAGLPKN